MPIPEFVLELRQLVGKRPLWLPGITAVILDGDRLLMVRRADDGNWTPITGIVDPGEEPADTAVREALEETGVTIEVERLASVQVTPEIVYDNGDQAQYLDLTFRCRYVSGEAHVADDETTGVGWYPLDALPDPTPEHFRDRIESALDRSGPARYRRTS